MKELAEENYELAKKFNQGYPKPVYVVDENTPLTGGTYKSQLGQVKKIIENFLIQNN